MKRSDWVCIGIVVVLLLPFFISSTGALDEFKRLTGAHPFIMSFFKFGILATFGELLALRIRKGVWYEEGFGVLPRALVWGVLGVFICGAMTTFKAGIMQLIAVCGADSPAEVPLQLAKTVKVFLGDLSLGKVGIALAISVAMNSFFAPVFMTFHKITDTHIVAGGGSLAKFFTPIPVRRIITTMNWDVQWSFVFKKTIPLFWYPAHTVTFLLPADFQVLFAAALGVALGVILAVAANKS